MIKLPLTVSLLLLSVAAEPATGNPHVYIYKGNPFTSVSAGWPTDPTFVTAKITLANRVAPNGSVQFLVGNPYPDLISASISDGARTFTQNDPGIINLYADKHGFITRWTIAMGTYSYPPTSYSFAINSWGPGTTCDVGGNAYYSVPSSSPGCPTDFTHNTLFDMDGNPYPVDAGNSNDFGAWITPEPGKAGILIFGALLLPALHFRRSNRRTTSPGA